MSRIILSSETLNTCPSKLDLKQAGLLSPFLLNNVLEELFLYPLIVKLSHFIYVIAVFQAFMGIFVFIFFLGSKYFLPDWVLGSSVAGCVVSSLVFVHYT